MVQQANPAKTGHDDSHHCQLVSPHAMVAMVSATTCPPCSLGSRCFAASCGGAIVKTFETPDASLLSLPERTLKAVMTMVSATMCLLSELPGGASSWERSPSPECFFFPHYPARVRLMPRKKAKLSAKRESRGKHSCARGKKKKKGKT